MVVLPEQEKQKVAGFYRHEFPSKMYVVAYFEDRLPGVTYVDDIEFPSISIVVTEFHHVSFVGWRNQPTDFTEELSSLLDQEIHVAVVWDGNAGIPAPEKNLEGRLGRLEFRNRDLDAYERVAQVSLGEPMNVQPLSDDNLERCESYEEFLYAYEVKQAVLKECFGLVCFDGDKYVGDVSAICRASEDNQEEVADVQIVVTEGSRRTGVATRLVCRLFEEMKVRNIRPVWTCHKDNEGSVQLARKLGFRNPIEFEILNYSIKQGFPRYWSKVLTEFGTTYPNRIEATQYLQKTYDLSRLNAHWLTVHYLRNRD